MDDIRIAMWSGPRNISTAMMRSWGNRADTTCWDEPFYAWYLQETGIRQPGWEEVIATHEDDWLTRGLWCLGCQRRRLERVRALLDSQVDLCWNQRTTHQLSVKYIT